MNATAERNIWSRAIEGAEKIIGMPDDAFAEFHQALKCVSPTHHQREFVNYVRAHAPISQGDLEQIVWLMWSADCMYATEAAKVDALVDELINKATHKEADASGTAGASTAKQRERIRQVLEFHTLVHTWFSAEDTCQATSKPAAFESKSAAYGQTDVPHPLEHLAGSFRDDPLWDEMIEEMRIAEESGVYDNHKE